MYCNSLVVWMHSAERRPYIAFLYFHLMMRYFFGHDKKEYRCIMISHDLGSYLYIIHTS